jgi:hypothetical protein
VGGASAKKPVSVGRRLPNSGVADLIALEKAGDYDQLIVVLRERIAVDRRVLTNAWVKQWLGRRWRDVFLTDAIRDPKALEVASARIAVAGRPPVRLGRDPRSDRQKIAERFLAHNNDDWRLELPAARPAGQKLQSVVYCPSLVHTGIRVGYPSPKLLRGLSRSERRRVQGRVVLTLTANPSYALHGVRPGARLRRVARRLRVGRGFRIGLNVWYLAPNGASRGVLKVRRGVIEEIGIADEQLTGTRRATRRFLASFS